MTIDDQTVVKAIAGGRIAIGTAFLAAPGLALKAWPGRDDDRPLARSLARSLGGRDLALGLGLLLALRHDSDPLSGGAEGPSGPLSGGAQGPSGALSGKTRGWLEAGMLTDSADALAIALAWRHLPRGRAVVVFAGAVAAVVAARRLVDTLG